MKGDPAPVNGGKIDESKTFLSLGEEKICNQFKEEEELVLGSEYSNDEGGGQWHFVHITKETDLPIDSEHSCDEGVVRKPQTTMKMERSCSTSSLFMAENACLQNFICHHCGALRQDRSSLKIHIRFSHFTPPFSISKVVKMRKCKRLTKLEMKFFQCPFCTISYDYQTSLKRHIMANHHRVKPFECSYCNYRCLEPNKLKNHVRVVHEKVKAFVCHHCGVKFGHSHTLKTHIMAKHEKFKPWVCLKCGHRFVQSSNLKSHLKTHGSDQEEKNQNNGRLNKQCPFCDYKCGHLGHLKSHVMAKHQNLKPYVCPHCEYRSKRRTHLQSHITRRHQMLRPHFCLYCSYKCSTSTELKYHLTRKHNNSQK